MGSRPAWPFKRAAFCALLLILAGCDLADWLPAGGAAPKQGAPESETLSTPQARAAKANSELMQEIYKVVFMQEATDRAKFGEFVDTLNQGASFEGIYNGFTHSSFYRKFETEHPGAKPGAIHAFADELAHLEVELPKATEFTRESAQPLPVLGDPSTPDAPAAAPRPQAPMNEASLAEQYSNLFSGASIYTLKRVLGDEALKVIAFKKAKPGELARWYAPWVVRMAGRHVDFGLGLRNKADEQFHFSWVAGVPEDRLTWEVLNRVHRVLNQEESRDGSPDHNVRNNGS